MTVMSRTADSDKLVGEGLLSGARYSELDRCRHTGSGKGLLSGHGRSANVWNSPELPSELTLIFIADRLSDELFWINNERLVELEMLGITIVDFADSMPCDF